MACKYFTTCIYFHPQMHGTINPSTEGMVAAFLTSLLVFLFSVCSACVLFSYYLLVFLLPFLIHQRALLPQQYSGLIISKLS
jgi:hypothetical protein